ncbi:MAG TPA: hypothetical protein DEH78_03350 [Solibacterales bacterium]|nr:hypothetical protein [Bryobacterales bacterium]
MFGIGKIVGAVIGGPAGIVGLIAGDLFKNLLSKKGPGSDLSQTMNVLQNLMNKGGGLVIAAPQAWNPSPMPFSPVGGNTAAMAMPGQPQIFQQLADVLNQLVQALQKTSGGAPQGAAQVGGGAGYSAGSSSSIQTFGGGSPAAAPTNGSTDPGGFLSSGEQSIAQSASKIDGMMSQAESLMSSDKPSDQIKGQMLMQKAMRLFEMISKMQEMRSKAQSTAIQNMK